MGKIFEAMYGADGESVEHDNGSSSQQVVEERVENNVRRYPDNLILPLGRTFDGNAKWRRDMRKVTINLMVQADPEEVGGKSVMFSGMSRGVGTTTVTSQVAKILAAEYPRHRVLILDVRDSGSSADAMTLDRAMMEGFRADEILAGCEGEGIFRMLVSSSDDQGRSAMISHHVREFIAKARDEFDWVLLDMPQQGSTPLADSIGRVVDGVAIVANTGVTRVPAINAVEEDMDQLGIKLLGVILNFRKYPIPSWLLKFL
ncbi:hypothetical protein [Pontibacterium sp.]|uniref:hypothetical protein n=1 Tax=Pontibacterium sp. TaxID=2036026 RepID=UPI0035129718